MKRTSIVPEQQASGSKSIIDLKTGRSVLPHAKIPHVDIDWALEQSPTVLRLLIESWRCDSFGTSTLRGYAQWHNLETKFQKDNFRKARKAIEQQGLFQYRKVTDVRNGQRITVWQCTNLHGYYSGFWSQSDSPPARTESAPAQISNPPTRTDNPPTRTDNPPTQIENPLTQIENPLTRTENPGSMLENQLNQGVQECQLLTNYSSITPLPPTKVVEEEVMIPAKELQATLGGSLASERSGLEEEPPSAADEPAAPPEASADLPTPLLNQLEAVGDEPKDQGVDQCSVSDHTSESNQAHTADKVPQGFPFQIGDEITIAWSGDQYDGCSGQVKKLYGESNEVDVQFRGIGAVFCFPMGRILGSNVPLPDEKPRFNAEHAQKRKARLSRLELSKRLGECPGIEFLTECWEDIILRSHVKSLVAKYPQWGFEFP